ncbi:hypothetical protein EYF80_064840 [Liparis tanakae]|uniref:Uncharacterized protein n=1 Tax=Liparis tanakae TaxID=230148 RepID=A0A4Z2E8N1_9TELE|nr:hypothetical protein EYF80_064840 [Liparis tanakae]
MERQQPPVPPPPHWIDIMCEGLRCGVTPTLLIPGARGPQLEGPGRSGGDLTERPLRQLAASADPGGRVQATSQMPADPQGLEQTCDRGAEARGPRREASLYADTPERTGEHMVI